jgi:type VI secretion system protein ImpA
MLSIEQLLIPVSVAEPCGADLSFSMEVDAIARARQHDDPSLDQGEWTVALKEADWIFVASQCAQLIQSRSKDLKLAVWLAEASARIRAFRGLADGFGLLAGLCERHWEGLHPLGEQGDYEQRIGNLCWLLAQTPALVKEMTVSEDGGISMADFERARHRAALADRAGGGGGVGAWPSDARGGDEGPTVLELDAHRRQNSEAFNAALLEDAEYCLSALRALEQAVDARLGADGPSFGTAREALQNAVDFIGLAAPSEERTAVADGAGGMGGAGELGEWACMDGASGAARDRGAQHAAPPTRAQALAQLRQIAEFFRSTEPHSPIAYLVDKAASWGEMPLHEWLRTVVKDPAQAAQLDELLGVCRASE